MCGETSTLGLKMIDGLALNEQYRSVLRPGEIVPDRRGKPRRLPRFFYEVTSWEQARALELAPGFALWEFINVDVREVEVQRLFPRYVPCGVTAMAAALSVFRDRVNALVHIAANGGYRSPSHVLSAQATPHCWGTGANIYRIGDDYLDSEEKIEQYRKVAGAVLPGAWTLPYGLKEGCSGDHLHIDIGYLTLVPPGAEGDIDPVEGGAS